MAQVGQSDNTPVMTDSQGHRWNVHQPSLDVARRVIANMIHQIFSNANYTQERKMFLVEHLLGLNHVDMAKDVQALKQTT